MKIKFELCDSRGFENNCEFNLGYQYSNLDIYVAFVKWLSMLNSSSENVKSIFPNQKLDKLIEFVQNKIITESEYFILPNLKTWDCYQTYSISDMDNNVKYTIRGFIITVEGSI